MQPRRSNYDAWCEQWRQRFLEMDPQELLRRLPEVRDERMCLSLRHYGRRLCIDKQSGEITAPDDDATVGCYEKLNVYTLFGYVRPDARLNNNLVKFDDLKNASPFSKAFRAGVTDPFARTFSGNAARLEDALRRLGGRKLPCADVAYELSAFECIPIRFLFWEADEEFPAQANLLFDESATDFIHVESIVTIASLGLTRLAQIADLPLDKSAFGTI